MVRQATSLRFAPLPIRFVRRYQEFEATISEGFAPGGWRQGNGQGDLAENIQLRKERVRFVEAGWLGSSIGLEDDIAFIV